MGFHRAESMGQEWGTDDPQDPAGVEIIMHLLAKTWPLQFFSSWLRD